jgi:hypothetical protein
MSIEDQFLNAMTTGGNGFTVRFVPSNDGERLNAVPVPDLHLEFRMWLMLLMSLVATVTFTAGHAPPGGFWSADDEAKGYVAGTSVMRDKFHCRYLVFYYSNSVAFFLSLAVIVMLARIKKGNDQADSMRDQFIVAFLVSFCIASLGTSYIAGSWDSPIHGMAGMTAFVIILFYMSFHWIIGANELIKQKSPSNGNDHPLPEKKKRSAYWHRKRVTV